MNRAILVTTAISITCGILVILGFVAGRYSISKSYRDLLTIGEKTETLATVLEPEITPTLTDQQRRNYYLPYYEGENIKERAHDIAWAGKIVLTPFVGNAQWPGQHHNAYINSLQFRAKNEVQIPKPVGVFRIFITGGSTAYGSGAPSQERTIGGYLEKKLNEQFGAQSQVRYEVFTMANPGWASTHERIVIENLLSELEPDLVISLSGNNDVFWANDGKNILWFHDFVNGFVLTLLNKIYLSSGRKPMPDVTMRTTAPVPVPVLTVADRLAKNLRLSSYVLSLSGANYVFALQPTLAVSSKPLSVREQAFVDETRDYYTAAYRAIAQLASRLEMSNFAYIDLADVFSEFDAKDEIFLDSFHFADRGNEIIVQALLRRLRDLRLLANDAPF